MRKAITVVALLVTAALGGVGVATALTGDAELPSAGTPDDLAPKAGSERVESGAAHPVGGPPWAVLVYESKTGKECAAVGRRVNGQVGELAANGRFTPYPTHEGGSCVDLDAIPSAISPLMTSMAYDPGDPTSERTTLVWGLAKPAVASVVVDGPDGRRELRPSASGAFVTAYRGDAAVGPFTVSARTERGTDRFQLGPVPLDRPDPEVVEQEDADAD